MANDIERREFLASLIVIPLGAAVAGCGEDPVEPPEDDGSCEGLDGVSTEVFGHTHTICVAQTLLDKPPKENVVITTVRMGDGGHTHTITLTPKQVTTLAEETGALKLTTSEALDHVHQFTLGLVGVSGDMG